MSNAARILINMLFIGFEVEVSGRGEEQIKLYEESDSVRDSNSQERFTQKERKKDS